MTKPIIRNVVIDGEEYDDYDGDEEIEERDEDWDLFNESFNW